jgi:DNA (cytosine-5)-methyltransferase 1
MSRPLLLDLFCGAGGCAVGYHRAGFDVVGVDLRPQPRYPFPFIQSGAVQALQALLRCGGLEDSTGRVWTLSDFAAIHASPPCQAFSVGRRIHQSGHKHPDLVEPCRQLLDAIGLPWVMENVIGAPLRDAAVLCGLMFGLKVIRHRQFEASFLLLSPPHPQHPKGNLTNSNQGYSTGEHGFVCVAGNNFVREAGARAMGIDWMQTRKELAQAIPPAFTEYVGRQLIDILEAQ